MTRQQFLDLDIGTKLNVVKDFGNLVDHLEREEESLLCYAINKFFVEVVYSTKNRELLRIVVFEGGRQLDKYSNLKNEL